MTTPEHPASPAAPAPDAPLPGAPGRRPPYAWYAAALALFVAVVVLVVLARFAPFPHAPVAAAVVGGTLGAVVALAERGSPPREGATATQAAVHAAMYGPGALSLLYLVGISLVFASLAESLATWSFANTWYGKVGMFMYLVPVFVGYRRAGR